MGSESGPRKIQICSLQTFQSLRMLEEPLQ